MVGPRALLLSLLGLALLAGCTASHDVDTGGFPYEALPAELRGNPNGNCEEQMQASQDGLAEGLECTGLYENIKSKKLAKGVEEYEPAYKLWSDGAEKYRYIALPDKKQIDNSDPNSWQFPVGTKIWKEFQANDQRAETRLYVKQRADRWVKATYVWENAGKAKRKNDGKKMSLDGATYEVPGVGLCNDCHDGAKDNVLGFEGPSLGLPGATGVTLQKLVDKDLLSDPPARTSYQIGEDSTGKARDVMGWLHINCGTTCHNAGENSKAEVTDLRMKLSVEELDGRPADQLQLWKQLVNQDAKTTQWVGMKRIVPGKPDESLLYNLITTRLGIDGNKQMPPLLTRVVDEEHAEMIRNWILALPPAQTQGATAAQ